MGMGSALTGGYNAARAAADSRSRSYMPMINTLGQMIRDSRARNQGRSVALRSPGLSSSEMRSQEINARHEREALIEEEKRRYEEQQQIEEAKTAEANKLAEAENARRDELQQQNMAQKEQAMDITGAAAGRQDKIFQAQEAYQQAKQGLMMGDNKMIQDAIAKMTPDQGQEADNITYSKTPTGERKITARPKNVEAPQFIFHPQGYVGVVFPGQDKPVVFRDAKEAFTRVIAPMNPQQWTQKPGTAKDQVQSQRNIMEADYKQRELRRKIHKDADAAAMKQFYADGYYQPALYNDKQYWKSYNQYVKRATGKEPPAVNPGTAQTGRPSEGRRTPYTGEKPPANLKGARREADGTWSAIDPSDGKRKRVLGSPDKAPKKAKPKRRSMPTASNNMMTGGVNITSHTIEKPGENPRANENFNADTGRFEDLPIYKGDSPPQSHPDAQRDEKTGAWLYFDQATETWKEVRE